MKAKLLIIDFEKDAEPRVVAPLEKLGFKTEFVRSEIEILGIAKSAVYDMIIFNPELRNGNDNELLPTLIGHAKTKGAVVFVISSSSDRERIQKSIGLGAVDYLVMPCLPDEIGKRVEKNLPLKFDFHLLKQCAVSLNSSEPRILDMPFFKKFKEKYSAFPIVLQKRNLCILVSNDIASNKVAELKEEQCNTKVIVFRKFSSRWELAWPIQ